jgi:ankyrin repeat protein
LKIILKSIFDENTGVQKKNRLISSKGKYFVSFSASDAVSWFLSRPHFLYIKKLNTQSSVEDCIALGKLFQTLGIIENVSNFNSFENDSDFYIFKFDLSVDEVLNFLVQAYHNLIDSNLKNFKNKPKEQRTASPITTKKSISFVKHQTKRTDRFSFPMIDRELNLDRRRSLNPKLNSDANKKLQCIQERSLELCLEISNIKLNHMKKISSKMKVKQDIEEIILHHIYHNEVEKLKELLTEESCILINSKYNYLHFASFLNRIEIIAIILKEGISIDCEDKSLKTSLHIATEFGHASQVSFLVQNGASVNARDVNGNTPLHIAFQKRFYSIAGILMSDGDVSLKKINGRTVLHELLQSADLKGIQTFLNFNIENNSLFSSTDNDGNTPFMILFTTRNYAEAKDCIGLLIKNKKVKVMAKNNFSQNFVHLGIIHGNWNLIEFCLKSIQGFSGILLQTKDIHGNTPFHLIAKYGNVESVQYFLNLNFSPYIKNEEGITPIMIWNNRNPDKKVFQKFEQKI